MTKVMTMEPQLAEALERLSREAATSAEPGVARDAARATGGLPVQCDMGGVLLLTPTGAVLHYDPEGGTIAPVSDDRWRTAAFVKAARKHPELTRLFPTKPSGAAICAQCSGSGRMFGTLDCGNCMGTGWLPALVHHRTIRGGA
jgi:hypothetical protein